MDFRIVTLLAFQAVLSASPAAAQSLSLVPGQWETSSLIEVSIEQDGETVETFPLRQTRADICVPSSAAELHAEALAGEDCTSTAARRDGLALILDLTCQHEERQFQGTMIATSAENGQGALAEMELESAVSEGRIIHINATLTGRHLGPCL